MAATGRTSWDAVTASALAGMPGTSASSGSWTITCPPACAIASAPAAPSSSAPERTTATAAAPQAPASERNIGSAAGRTPFSFGPRLSSIRSARISRWWSAGAT